MIKIAVVDDHQLFRNSLSMLLNSIAGTKVVFETSDGALLLKHLRKNTIDVAMIDVRQPHTEHYKFCRALTKKNPTLRVIVVSQLDINESAHRYFKSGVSGFLGKDASAEQLANCIRSVTEKHPTNFGLSHLLAQAAALPQKSELILPEGRRLIEFSKREMEIIRLSCRERSNKQIADDLSISIRTVEQHRKRMMERTGTKNFIGTIMFVLKHQLLHIDDL
ncbi:response regulator transcription factor [Flavobacterium sp. HJ-32-4]|uniref:response regulator transcription factor n=2 Tax=unclassified Flavobacterium TaxID=196869 RepID=UPI0021128A91|nr:response regulator transcription factor [Flavobacterium sp. HJ-32-4]